MVLHYWQHNIRMYFFTNKTWFSKTVLIYITFTWCINQHPLLNIFSFLLPQAFLLINFITIQLHHYSASSLFNFTLSLFNFTSSLLINLIITYQLDFSLFRTLNFWQLPSCFRVSSYFLLFFGCCKCSLPCIRLSLHYEKH